MKKLQGQMETKVEQYLPMKKYEKRILSDDNKNIHKRNRFFCCVIFTVKVHNQSQKVSFLKSFYKCLSLT